jgi:parallel beta-helix repeat protein
MKQIRYFNYVLGLFFSLIAFTASAQTVTIGTGTSSSYTYGPIYRFSASSTTDFSRYHYIYTAAELSAVGIVPGSTISSLAWYKNSTFVVTGTGNATLNVYAKNSSATVAANNTWTNLIAGSTQVHAGVYNTTTNLPNTVGWWTINFSTPLVYTGGSIEISADWDCSTITGNPSDGAFNWLYGTAPATLTTYATSTALPTSTTSTSASRPNIQFTHTAPTCAGPTGLAASSIMATSAGISWNAAAGSAGYNWLVVAAGAGSGGTAVASGNAAGTTASATGLAPLTSYDLYVRSDCGGGSLSVYSGPYNFTTACTGPLSGTYTVGGAGADYATVAAAVTALNSCGISGAVTFNVAAGTYTGSVSIGQITGSSAANTVTFNGASAATTTITHDGTGQYATVQLNGADYVTFQNLTIANTATTNGWGVLLTNQANYNTINNCIINSNTAATATSVVGVLASGSTTSTTTTGNNANYTTISNTTFSGGYYGVRFYGNTSAAADQTNNTVSSCTFNSIYGYAIHFYYQDNPIATGNTVNGTTATFGYGVYSQNSRHGVFTGNTLTGMKSYGIWLATVNATAQTPTQRTTVANNMVTGSGAGDGIYLSAAINVDIFYNSVTAETDQALWINSTSTGYDIRNNIFAASGAEPVDLDAAPTTEVIDYNVYYRSGAGIIASVGTPTYADLAAWITADATRNANSLSGDPSFLGTTNLHVQGILANGEGTPIVGVTTDIDGDTRNATTPDIGADEFTPPSCFAPSGLNATNLSLTGATLGWTAGGSETAWDVQYGVSGFALGTGTTVSAITANPYSLTGLTASTNYQFYVRAACSSSNSTWAGPYTFYTGYCQFASTSALSYFDAFTTTGGATNISNTASGYATGGYQNATAMVVSQYATGSVNFATTLMGTTVGVSIWIDWNNNLVFDVSERVYNSGTSYVATASGTITVPAGTPVGSYRMRAVMDYNATSPNACSPAGTRAEAEDYTFAVIAAPACVPPTTLTATNLTPTGASLGWTVTGTETAWDIEWGASGFTQGTGTIVTATTTNPYALSGLSANTAYQFYVRANCGSGTTSSWAGPYSFTTPCVAFTVPYFEGFEAGYVHNTTVGGCLSQESVVGTQAWTANNTFTDYNRAPYAGAWNAFLRYGNTDWLFIPIALTGGVSYTFGCYARQDYATVIDADIAVAYGTANNATAMTNTIVATTGLTNGAYQQITGAFTPTTTGTYYIGIKGYMSGNPFYISLDNISVIATPTCPPMTALTASNITATSANVAWTGTGASFQVQYGAAGFTPGSGMTVTSTTNTASLTGLTFETNYNFYVRAICAVGDTSPWSATGSFFTGYCTPAPSNVDGQGITNVSMGGVSNTTVAEVGNYGNYTAMVAYASQGGTFPINITYQTGYTYDTWAWVDWNNDLDFTDAGEEYYLGNSTIVNPTTLNGSIAIPVSAAIGNYRIRIGGADTGLATTSPSNSCYTGSWAAFEDYTLSVGAPLTATASVTTAILCNGASSGAAMVTAAAGLAPYTYLWSDTGAQTTATATGLAAGTYYVTVTDANTNTTVASVTITDPAAVTVSVGAAFSLAGTTWKMAPQAQALAVGPTQGSAAWWSNSLADVTTRACFFDDEYVFNANGTFSNVLGMDTWIEGWQGGTDACGTPVAPHNGSAAATWTYDQMAGTVTVNGTGAYLGLAKVHNNGELTSPANAVSSITYLATFTGDSIMTLDINFGPGYWRFVLKKTAPAGVAPITNVTCNGGNDGSAVVSATGGTAPYTYAWDANAGSQTTATATGLAAGTYTVTATDANGCTGNLSVTITEPTAVDVSIATAAPLLEGTTWKMAPQAQALAVGPTQGSAAWWSNSLGDVTTRACFFDDEYVFNANGTFSNVLGVDTWIEGWQGGTDACGTPVAPHNGTVAGTWTYDPTAGTITVNGTGAYLGLAKVHNNGELTSPANAVSSITYLATFTGDSIMTLDINFGAGWWRFVLEKTASQPPVALVTNVTCNGGNDGSATVNATGGAGSYTYLWDANAGSQTTATATGLAAGTYTVTATDASGCTDNLSVTITEPTAVTATIATADVDCNGNSTGTATVTAAGGTMPYTYLWSDGQTTAIATNLPAALYGVIITDANGCMSADSATISEPTELTVTTTSVADTNNLSIGQASATAAGGTPSYTYSWDNGMTGSTISGLGSGLYAVTVTDGNGCTTTGTVQVDSISTGLEQIDFVTNLKVFPNPTAGNITIDLELSDAKDVNVVIYDISGQLIKDFGHEYTSRTQIRTDLSIFPSGVYLVRFVIEDQVITKRLILSKY